MPKLDLAQTDKHSIIIVLRRKNLIKNTLAVIHLKK